MKLYGRKYTRRGLLDRVGGVLVCKQPMRRTYVTALVSRLWYHGSGVTALEPSNCWNDGRAAERASDTLVTLETVRSDAAGWS